MDNKIDFVIPWVDGEDPLWLKERNKYGEKQIINTQYRDWDLLKYWFRGVEKYAPWVNKIYFLTWGHIPEFLDLNNPKLVIVNHKDFIPEQYLPTFSANVIDTNIHRIRGLSEKFVYFNDDVFIVNPVKESDFFLNGLPLDTAIMKPIDPARYDSIASLMLNNVSIVNENFNKKKAIRENVFKWINVKYGFLTLLNIMFLPWPRFMGFYEQHLSNSYLKTTFEEVWAKEFDVLNATGNNKVRNFKVDVNQWIFKNWRIAKGEFVPRNLKFGKYVMVDSIEKAEQTAKIITSSNTKILCINDHYKGANLDEVINTIIGGFDNVLKEKSSFEK